MSLANFGVFALSCLAIIWLALVHRQLVFDLEDKDADAVLRIVWREFDGPAVSAPAKFNFGSKLITSMLKQIGAELEPTFAETGYCYTITVPDAR